MAKLSKEELIKKVSEKVMDETERIIFRISRDS